MNLLAIDCACSILSVAVCKSFDCREEIFYEEIQAGIRHSELVMDLIDSQMKKASLKAENLEGVLCLGGPGSFTGLRIGYSIAKGLALSLSIPFIPVPTLDCMAFPYRDHSLVLAAIESKKNAWFYTFYNKGKPLFPVTDADTAHIAAHIKELGEHEAEKITLTGAGAASLFDTFDEDLKNKINLAFEKHGYAKELIAIAKTLNLFENYNDSLLYSGPEYFRD